METEQAYLESLNKHIAKVYDPEYADEVRAIFLNNWRRERQCYDTLNADNRTYALAQYETNIDPSVAKEWNDYSLLSKAFIQAMSFIAGWEIDRRTALEKLLTVVVLANERLKNGAFDDSVFSKLAVYREVLEKTGLDCTFSEFEVFRFVEKGYQYNNNSCENRPLLLLE